MSGTDEDTQEESVLDGDREVRHTKYKHTEKNVCNTGKNACKEDKKTEGR